MGASLNPKKVQKFFISQGFTLPFFFCFFFIIFLHIHIKNSIETIKVKFQNTECNYNRLLIDRVEEAKVLCAIGECMYYMYI